MVCLAVRSAFFELQGRYFEHKDRKALVPNVIMFVVVVQIIIIEHGLRRPAFYSIGRSRYFVGVKVRTVCFGNDLGFRPLIQATGSFCVSNTYISALFKILLTTFVGHYSSGAVCDECSVK